MSKLTFHSFLHFHLICPMLTDWLNPSYYPLTCLHDFFVFQMQTEQLVTLWILFIVTIAGNAIVLFSTWRRKRKSRMTFFVTQLAITGSVWEGKGHLSFTGISMKMRRSFCINKEMQVEWQRIQLPPNVQMQLVIRQMDGCLS